MQKLNQNAAVPRVSLTHDNPPRPAAVLNQGVSESGSIKKHQESGTRIRESTYAPSPESESRLGSAQKARGSLWPQFTP
jgi:hypothetical protein